MRFGVSTLATRTPSGAPLIDATLHLETNSLRCNQVRVIIFTSLLLAANPTLAVLIIQSGRQENEKRETGPLGCLIGGALAKSIDRLVRTGRISL